VELPLFEETVAKRGSLPTQDSLSVQLQERVVLQGLLDSQGSHYLALRLLPQEADPGITLLPIRAQIPAAVEDSPVRPMSIREAPVEEAVEGEVASAMAAEATEAMAEPETPELPEITVLMAPTDSSPTAPTAAAVEVQAEMELLTVA
jgi:hypothetical protein